MHNSAAVPTLFADPALFEALNEYVKASIAAEKLSHVPVDDAASTEKWERVELHESRTLQKLAMCIDAAVHRNSMPIQDNRESVSALAMGA